MSNQDISIRIMLAAVAVSVAAMIAIAIMAAGMVRAALSLRNQAGTLLPQVRTLIAAAEGIASANRGNLKAIAASTTEVLRSLSSITGKTEHLAGEMATRANAQVERVEMIASDTAGRVRQTAAEVNKAVHPFLTIAGTAGQLRFGTKQILAAILRRR